MARYKKGGNQQEKLGELENMLLLAIHIATQQCEICTPFSVGQGDVVWVPGRALSEIAGGKWTSYRHSIMMRLKGYGWIEAWKGYEKGSDKKELWRYSITPIGKSAMLEFATKAARDCYVRKPNTALLNR